MSQEVVETVRSWNEGKSWVQTCDPDYVDGNRWRDVCTKMAFGRQLLSGMLEADVWEGYMGHETDII